MSSQFWNASPAAHVLDRGDWGTAVEGQKMSRGHIHCRFTAAIYLPGLQLWASFSGLQDCRIVVESLTESRRGILPPDEQGNQIMLY